MKPGVDLLGPVDEIFYETCDRFVPTNKHEEDNCFISTVSKIPPYLYFDFSRKDKDFPYLQPANSTSGKKGYVPMPST